MKLLRGKQSPGTDSREMDPFCIHSLISSPHNLEPFPSIGC